MNALEGYRQRIDRLDVTILDALGERFDVCREVARYKRDADVPMMQPGRVEEVRARYRRLAEERRVPLDFVEEVFERLIVASCALEDAIIEERTP